jgi:hypothetical protein
VRLFLTLASVLLVSAPFKSQETNSQFGLPELHAIKTVTLSPSYSCRSKEAFRGGYSSTALFLSKYSDDRNSPDLLFNGACGSADYFEASTAGDDMSLIADLGNVPLEEVTTSKAFNFKRIHSFDLYSRFTREAKVEAAHTYAILINKSSVRGLFIVSVAGFVPNQKVDLRYAVKEYQVLNVKGESEGFDWSAKNQAPCGER